MAKPMTALDRTENRLLRTAIAMTADDGRYHALVEAHGELCAYTAPQLRIGLEQIIDDGATDITIDLQHLTLCTSHGLDLFDDIHNRLQRLHDGTLHLRLDTASDIVKRVVYLIHDNDPTFSPHRADGPRPGRTRPSPPARRRSG